MVHGDSVQVDVMDPYPWKEHPRNLLKYDRPLILVRIIKMIPVYLSLSFLLRYIYLRSTPG